jgi:hypothetical protein
VSGKPAAAAGEAAAGRRRLGAFRGWRHEAIAVFRKGGFRGILRAYGWKVFAAFVLFYLIRDVTLYIVLPYLAARGLLSFWR